MWGQLDEGVLLMEEVIEIRNAFGFGGRVSPKSLGGCCRGKGYFTYAVVDAQEHEVF